VIIDATRGLTEVEIPCNRGPFDWDICQIEVRPKWIPSGPHRKRDPERKMLELAHVQRLGTRSAPI
jgi:hypothetical protein